MAAKKPTSKPTPKPTPQKSSSSSSSSKRSSKPAPQPSKPVAKVTPAPVQKNPPKNVTPVPTPNPFKFVQNLLSPQVSAAAPTSKPLPVAKPTSTQYYGPQSYAQSVNKPTSGGSSGGYPTGGSSGGQSYSAPQQQSYTQPQQEQYSYDQGGSSGGSSGGYEQYYQSEPEQPQIDFDAMINPALQGLDELIAPLQQGVQGDIASIESQTATGVERTKQQTAAEEARLAAKRIQQMQEGETGVNEQRQGLSEVMQGLQSRYGGSTGTGAFASELAGRSTLGNIGQIRQKVSAAMQDIDNKVEQVRQVGQIAIQDAEDKKTAAISQAKGQLENELANIRRLKGELQSRKAELAVQAIQLYQQQVQQVNDNNARFKQDMALKQQEAENQLNLARQKATSIADSYKFLPLNQGKGKTPVILRGNQRTGQYDYISQQGGALGGEQGGELTLDDLLRQAEEDQQY